MAFKKQKQHKGLSIEHHAVIGIHLDYLDEKTTAVVAVYANKKAYKEDPRNNHLEIQRYELDGIFNTRRKVETELVKLDEFADAEMESEE